MFIDIQTVAESAEERIELVVEISESERLRLSTILADGW